MIGGEKILFFVGGDLLSSRSASDFQRICLDHLVPQELAKNFFSWFPHLLCAFSTNDIPPLPIFPF